MRFRWTPQKRRTAALLGRGYTKVETARLVGTHRNLIHRWLNVPEFAAHVAAEFNEHRTAIRFRRLRMAVMATDHVEAQVVRALQEAAARPNSVTAVAQAKKQLADYRHHRRQERIEFGESATRKRLRRAGRRRMSRA